jgi:hypothetical protein
MREYLACLQGHRCEPWNKLIKKSSKEKLVDFTLCICMYVRGFTKFKITVVCGLKFHWSLRSLNLKFQKFTTKMEVFMTLP